MRCVTTDGDRRLLQGLLFDISDRKRPRPSASGMEIELRLAQKLEAVGQLAAGIAHEINTPIQFVGDNVRFLEDAFERPRCALAGRLRATLRRGRRPARVRASALARVRQAEEPPTSTTCASAARRPSSATLDGVERVADDRRGR